MIRNYIKNYERYAILISILMIFFSIFLIVKPDVSVLFFILLFGVLLVISGLGSLFSYFLTEKEDRLFSLDLISGILTILCGVFTIIYRTDLVQVLPIILGLWIIFSSLLKMQVAINFSSFSKSYLWLLLLEILMVILGVVLITNPFESIKAITTTAGVFLLISEVCSLIESYYILNTVKKL